MHESIQALIHFHAQKRHTNILPLSQTWELDEWKGEGILVGVPTEVGAELSLGDRTFLQDGTFSQKPGEPVMVDDICIGQVGPNFLLFNVCPTNDAAVRLVRDVIDARLPRMAHKQLKEQRNQFLEKMLLTSSNRRDELQEHIREADYQLADLSVEINKLARGKSMDERLLVFFNHPEKYFRNFALRSFADLMKLVPGVYAAFRFEGMQIIATTHTIFINHEGYDYEFDPYEVIYDLRTATVSIKGAENDNNGYIHPHVTGGGSICWGNIGGLVARLAGEMDLVGLFQLVHQFLATYNENDPYQKLNTGIPTTLRATKAMSLIAPFAIATGTR